MKDLWPEDRSQDNRKAKKEWVENYDYFDEEGTLVFQVTRWKLPNGGKSFTQRKPTKTGGWEYTTTGLNKPLYRLPQVKRAIKDGDPIYVAEGEKDVHTLENFGLVATTNPGGAKSWTSKFSRMLEGASKVFVVSDNDAVGRRHAKTIVAELTDLGIDTEALEPPEDFKDVTDMVEKGKPLSELIPLRTDAAASDPYLEIVSKLRSLSTKDWPLNLKLAKARIVLDSAEFNPLDSGRLVRWDKFLAEPVEDYDWLIPGIIEKTDRVIIVAAEGVGKTMLNRQVALMSAAGRHPFTRAKMNPITVLFVDLENPERIIRRTSQKILEGIRAINPSTFEIPNAHLWSKPDGINILDTEHRTTLINVVEQVNPDLLIIGPIYKMMIDPGNRSAEAVTTEVAMHLDTIRTTFDCALWLEHHAPLGPADGSKRVLRPFGSSVWSRWPEFGLSLVPDPAVQFRYEFQPFRGAREERDWPKALHRDTVLPFASEWN